MLQQKLRNMKAKIIFRSLTLVFLLLCSGTVMMAQSREKDEKAAQEAEMKAKKEMLEQQQKQLQEQKKMQEEKMKQMEIIYADRARDFERQARESSRARVYVPSTGSNDFYFYTGDQSSTSQLTLRNSFDGGSDSSKGEFEVSEDTRHFRVTINGKVKSGEIRIIVNYPNGNTFKDMTINSAAQISFSQSVTISEEDPDKYLGDWTYKVIAEEAKGDYSLSIMTH
jgi:hypothetical protein